MNDCAVKVGKVLVDAEERRAFEVISLREKADAGKKPDDYVEAAARCIAKSMVNIITNRVDEISISRGIADVPHAIELEFGKRYEKIGDNVYKCWYDFSWNDKTWEMEKETFNMEDRFGFIYEYASTYFSEELVDATVKCLSDILGEPVENKTRFYKTHTWSYEVE
jgi:hypothetical protein